MEKEVKEKKHKMLSAFSIIIILIAVLGILTYILPPANFVGDAIVNGSGVVKAKISAEK